MPAPVPYVLTPAPLCEQARLRLNSLSRVTFPAEAMNYAFNSALERWATDTECLTGTATIDVAFASAEHPPETQYPKNEWFPHLLCTFRRVTWLAPGDRERPLEFCPYEDLPLTWRQDSPAEPYLYSMRGEEALILWRQPPGPGQVLIDGFTLENPIEGDVEDPAIAGSVPLRFPRHHREGLVRALCLELCEMNLEDPLLAARLPLEAAAYQNEVEKRNRGNRPERPVRVGGRRAMPSRIVAYDPVLGTYDARMLR